MKRRDFAKSLIAISALPSISEAYDVNKYKPYILSGYIRNKSDHSAFPCVYGNTATLLFANHDFEQTDVICVRRCLEIQLRVLEVRNDEVDVVFMTMDPSAYVDEIFLEKGVEYLKLKANNI